MNQVSESQDWLSSFFPSQQPSGKEDKWHLGHVITFTNLKSELMNAGQKDGVYPNFVKFTTKEIKRHIFLYVFHGLSPFPKVKMKFNSQERDCVNVNDFIGRQFPNGAQRRKRFKCFCLYKTHSFTLLLERLIAILSSIHFSTMYRVTWCSIFS